jgi:hypothetical protein
LWRFEIIKHSGAARGKTDCRVWRKPSPAQTGILHRSFA